MKRYGITEKENYASPLAGPPGDREILYWLAHGLWGGLHIPIWRLAGHPLPDERTEYRTLFPEPVTWKGWWDDEDSSEVLEHGDFWVNAWQPEGIPKYTRQWLQQEFSMGRKRELCLFWGHQPSETAS